jgi:hypothetical protein
LLVARRRVAERPDAFGDGVERVPQLGVLGHEHEVERVEHRTFHVPVEVVGLEIERVGVGQQARQALRNLLAVLVSDADIDARCGAGRCGLRLCVLAVLSILLTHVDPPWWAIPRRSRGFWQGRALRPGE